jgi:hypothetical protein
MGRLTNKNKTLLYSEENQINLAREKNGVDAKTIYYGKPIERLAEFEDFMEEMGFESLEDLKKYINLSFELSLIPSKKRQEIKALKERWEKLKALLEEDMEHNSKEYDESLCSAFQHYSATENWVLDRMQELEKENKMDNVKILNVQWFNNVGIVTIDNGFEVKTYTKAVQGFNEQEDVQDIISLGFKIYPEQLEKILSFYKEEDKGE